MASGLRETTAAVHCACGAHDAKGAARKAAAVDPAVKDRTLKRLRRIAGQIRGLQKMVGEERSHRWSRLW